MKLTRPLPLLLVLSAAAAFGLWRWQASSSAGPASAAAKPPSLVSAMRVRLEQVPAEVSANGTVTALKMVDLRAQVTTTVKEVLFKEGDDVKAGQLLFRLDDRNDRVNLDKAKAQAAKSRAALKDLERQLARAQELRSQQFIAQSALDSAQAQVDTQREAVAADLAAVRNAEVALSYNEIRAPFAGRAGAVSVYPGSLVSASPTGPALVSIAQLDPITVAFTLPERELDAVLRARQQSAGVSVEVRKPDGSARVTGQLSFVDNQVDAATGSVKLKASFANAERGWWPGQFVDVRLKLRTLEGAAVIPQAATILQGTERSVLVVDAEGKAAKRKVEVLHVLGEQLAVKGLKDGEQLILEGRQQVRPGQPVKVQPAGKEGGQDTGKESGKAASGSGAAAQGTASAAASQGASR